MALPQTYNTNCKLLKVQLAQNELSQVASILRSFAQSVQKDDNQTTHRARHASAVLEQGHDHQLQLPAL